MTRAIDPALTNLLALYTECIDAADYDAVGDLFAHGDLADAEGNVIAEGATAVADFYRGTVQLHDGSPRTKHLVLNVLLEEPGAQDGAAGEAGKAGTGDRAVLRSSYLVLQQVDDQLLQPIITGRYRDAFVRRPGEDWRWERRQFFVDLVGDLGRHLSFEL